jgi:hypothetical protein
MPAQRNLTHLTFSESFSLTSPGPPPLAVSDLDLARACEMIPLEPSRSSNTTSLIIPMSNTLVMGIVEVPMSTYPMCQYYAPRGRQPTKDITFYDVGNASTIEVCVVANQKAGGGVLGGMSYPGPCDGNHTSTIVVCHLSLKEVLKYLYTSSDVAYTSLFSVAIVR